jgi:LysM repeat protein
VRKAVARIFAILAIAAVGVAIYSVVHQNLLKKDKDDPVTSTTLSTTSSAASKSSSKQHHYTPYVVKQGDVLSKIAEEHHVTVAQIKKLNPHLTPNQLHAGQHIQLR